MKQDIIVADANEMTMKNGKPYISYHTSEGKMSCFKEDVNKAIQEIGLYKPISVEVEKKGEFTNIMKCYGAGVKQETIKDEEPGKPVKEPAYTKDLNTAKDIFCVLYGAMVGLDVKEENISPEVLMDKAVKLVKQARDGLK